MIRVFLNQGDGTFAAPTLLAAGFGPAHVAIADFDGDGHLDIATANYEDITLSLFLNNGDGTFALSTTVSVGQFPAGVTAADLNGDGYPDLALASFGSNSLGVLLSRCR
jgi:Tfp pilus tip-associated adhesin PilY1